ncbi:sulfurtransferase TusA family protein [Pelagibacterium xiamenense]|uniref:sulfurtransferase TusA family protein n=1 Tax=Pelagibacterium xiamenense TaxID=2901140 RepID=UPI001E4A6CC0|nr:sulfurtransferase TusA family protein [Pelagibacterium xiamenense]MCD7061338.1 sulfurtransferase TusA family protein [Pelagibacterium xiamenense]
MTAQIDARGLRCPLPVLKLEKWLDQAAPAATVTILATDPVAKIDIPLFCTKNGHACAIEPAEGAVAFTVTKRGQEGSGTT